MSVLSGFGPPMMQGEDGDFYVDTKTDTIYGPRMGGMWGIGRSMVGPQGVRGEIGLQGLQGQTGQPGPTGFAGRDGKDGIMGATGPKGLDGKDGMNGKDGSDGMNGKDGSRGGDGKSGKHGTSTTLDTAEIEKAVKIAAITSKATLKAVETLLKREPTVTPALVVDNSKRHITVNRNFNGFIESMDIE